MLNRILSSIKSAGLSLLAMLSWCFRQLFGSFVWQAPAWALRLADGGRQCKAWTGAHPKLGAGIGLLILALAAGAAAGWHWYQNLPQPVYTHYTLKPPALSEYDELGHPMPQPFTIEFEESAAPVDKVGQTVQESVTLSPAVDGEWTWDDERNLSFRPKSDWPVDTEFTVNLDKKTLLAKGIVLDDYRPEFRSAPFSAEITEAYFYQDPTDANLKKLVATVHFSHPVDSEHVADKVKLTLADGLKFQQAGVKPETVVSYDEYKLNAYIHSASLAVPKEDSKLTVTVNKGLRAARGGNETASALSRDITVPGLYHLQFSNFHMVLADNERFEPEQILLIDSSAAVDVATLKGKVEAWLLPEFNPNTPPERRTSAYRWHYNEVTKDVLAASEPVQLTPQPTENDFEYRHGFKFHAPVGRTLFVMVKQGIKAFGGYQARTAYIGTVPVIPYPRAVKLLSQGALLSLNGEQKLAYMTRGLDGVKIEIGRLLPNQLHHLVDQTTGDFAQPNVDDYVLDTLVERFTENRPLQHSEYAKPSYGSIDFGRYLAGLTRSAGGVFMVKLQGYDPNNPYAYIDAAPDTRFILVTDLGIIAKRGVDGSQDVFVQSIAEGMPVAGAKVDVVGRNGQVVLTQTTDEGGHVRFPQLDDLQREKKALMYVVTFNDDLSFLPIGRGDRLLGLSRFDIGGLDNAQSPKQLLAYIFTDRGIYRPGETAHIGMIVRTADWAGNLEGVPLEVSITDPRGLEIFKQPIALARDGFDTIDFNSRDTSNTGEYHVDLYLIRNNARDQQIGSGSFKLRDFEPDRMKVKVNLSEHRVQSWITPEQAIGEVSAMQLFGAPAAGRRVEADMTLSPAIPAFPQYKDYVFKDQFKAIEPFKEKLTEAETGQDGVAKLNLNLARFARATYRLYLSAKVFEAGGGRSVSSDNAVLVSSAPYLVGVKADGLLSFIPRDAARSVRWLAINPELKPVAAESLTMELIERTYVSVLIQQSNGTYKYESRKKEIKRDSKPFAVAAGGTDWALATSNPGDFALVLKNADGIELNRLEYSVAGQANLSRSLERNAELQLSLDKAEYEPGDTVSVNIRAPYIGSGLITIERDHVYQHVWFKTDATSSVQSITLPKDFEGNGYVSVQFVRDSSSDEIFMSPLSYGVAPFSVSLNHRREPIEFSVADEIKPGDRLDMRIKTDAPARVVVFAVDEGILQVARYKKPDPVGFFFRKRALQVDTTQILDLILPEFRLLMNAAAPGGDGDTGVGRHVNPFKRKHKPPVAWWSGLIEVGPEGKELHYDVPDYYNGKLHLFAVAVNEGRIGVYDGETEVKGDLILFPNVPLSASPGDEFSVSVSVFNNLPEQKDGKAAPVTVSLTPSAGLSVASAAETVLNIANQQEGVAEFKVKVDDRLGPAELNFTAKIGDKAAGTVESLSVRPAVPFNTRLTLGRFDNGKQEAALQRDLYLERRDVRAGIAYSPLVWAQGLSQYLQEYSHVCTEQLVSKAIPPLVFRAGGPAERRHSFEKALQILRERQNDSGGFGLWAANFQVVDPVSVYAVHYLVEAKERGEPVPADMLSNADGWLEQLAAEGSEGLDGVRTRAYAIYLLTRQGIMTSSLLATLQQELDERYAKQWPEDLTAAYLAASYKLLQQDESAEQLIGRVPWSFQRKVNAADYYDPLVHDAQLLYLLSRHFREHLDDVPDKAMAAMGDAVSANDYNTLSSAYLILAFDAYGAAAGKDVSSLTIAEIDANGNKTPSAMTGRIIRSAEISPNARRIEYGSDASAPAFYMLSENGYDRKPLPPLSQGLEIAREFTGLDGAHLDQVKVGDEFLVKLTFRSTDRDKASQVAIVDLLPGGIEPVVNAKVQTASSDDAEDGEQENRWQSPIGEGDATNWWPDYADIREDRVVLYGSLQREIGTFVYRVRASNAGTYNVPPAFAEGMYDRRLLARGPASRLQVVLP